jgi:hypothetical protein
MPLRPLAVSGFSSLIVVLASGDSCFFSLVWLGGSALEERAMEPGREPFLSGLLLPGVEEASGASLSARSLELMVSV